MGCDIHMFAETKQNDFWESIGQNIYTDRDYTLFGVLAGVRNDWLPMVAPVRGLPDDISKSVRHIYDNWWDCDAHSASWVALDELVAYDWEEWLSGSKFCTKVIPFLQMLKAGCDDVRIVFWFDN